MKYLDNADQITVRTYYKHKCCIGTYGPMQDVYVSDISDLASGNVTARIGETDDYIVYNKENLKDYINFCGYSDTHC
jgi:hypothetical protein